METSSQIDSRRRPLGLLIALVGLWGGLIPFVGPTFGFDMGSTPAWTWSQEHATLHVAPALAAILAGGVLLLGSRGLVALGAAGLAAIAGVWFVIGPSLAPLWTGGASSSSGMGMGGMGMGGMAMGGHASAGKQALEAIGYHYGTGAVIAILASVAIGLLLATGAAREPATATARSRLRWPRRALTQP